MSNRKHYGVVYWYDEGDLPAPDEGKDCLTDAEILVYVTNVLKNTYIVFGDVSECSAMVCEKPDVDEILQYEHVKMNHNGIVYNLTKTIVATPVFQAEELEEG